MLSAQFITAPTGKPSDILNLAPVAPARPDEIVGKLMSMLDDVLVASVEVLWMFKSRKLTSLGHDLKLSGYKRCSST